MFNAVNKIVIFEDFPVYKALHQIGQQVAEDGVMSRTQEHP